MCENIENMEEIKENWNNLCEQYKGHSKIFKLSTVRKRHLKARLQEKEFTENWKVILEDAHKSDFLSGRKPGYQHPSFRGGFDWIIENDNNYLKILEGKYQNRQNKNMRKVDGIDYDAMFDDISS